ncbi:hypothetical protein M9Y10_030649 [Tritrichomonas musculus]|uniref:HNH nuclease domain-containing protein n=1 Tax=Tritrichomonas musculus TaxID=1915356 RepID=A0ABR2H2L3_9EUKA
MSQSVEQPQIENVDDEAEFELLKGFENDYEIQTTYPFVIRNKKTGKILKESLQHEYPRVCLNRKSYRKHILIGKQFIINDDPEHKKELDHINRDTTDYHLSNLRWITPSNNQRNRNSYKNIKSEYVDEISDDAITVNEYNNHEFTDYYFHDDTFYFFNGAQYRKLHINMDKRDGGLFVVMLNNEGKHVQVYYSKFKRLYDLM